MRVIVHHKNTATSPPTGRSAFIIFTFQKRSCRYRRFGWCGIEGDRLGELNEYAVEYLCQDKRPGQKEKPESSLSHFGFLKNTAPMRRTRFAEIALERIGVGAPLDSGQWRRYIPASNTVKSFRNDSFTARAAHCLCPPKIRTSRFPLRGKLSCH